MLLNTSSAVNQSWICLESDALNQLFNHQPPYWPSRECFFLYYQRFNVDLNNILAEPLFQTCIIFVVFVISLIVNIVQVYNYLHYQLVSREFRLLFTAYNLCNVAMVGHSAVVSLTKLQNDWLFGDLGCSLFFYSWIILTTISSWIMTIIGCERRFSIVSGGKKTNRDVDLRFRKHLFIVSFIFSFNISLWAYPFLFRKVARTTLVPIANVNKPVLICSIFVKTKFRYVADIIYFIITFLGPVLWNSYNYISIWLHVRQASRMVASKRSDYKLAMVAFISNAVFVIFTLPLHIVMFFVATYDRYNNQISQTELYQLAVVGISIRTIVNALFLVVSQRNSKQNQRQNKNARANEIRKSFVDNSSPRSSLPLIKGTKIFQSTKFESD